MKKQQVLKNLSELIVNTYDNFEDYLAESSMELYMANAGELVDAIEFLCDHAPIDSFSEKAMLSNRAACARFCHNGLKRRYKTAQKANGHSFTR